MPGAKLNPVLAKLDGFKLHISKIYCSENSHEHQMQNPYYSREDFW